MELQHELHANYPLALDCALWSAAIFFGLLSLLAAMVVVFYVWTVVAYLRSQPPPPRQGCSQCDNRVCRPEQCDFAAIDGIDLEVRQ